MNEEPSEKTEEAQEEEERPQRYGKCTVETKLGEGGMGSVYYGTHESLGIPVAVKVLPRYLDIKDPEYAHRFFREARLAAKLRHPNIVRVIDSGTEGNHHYLVMEYIDGETCREKVEKEDRLDWREAVEIIKQVADALGYAAESGVIHRDVTPDNIMIDSHGQARITDLGLAKEAAADRTGVTRTGASLGTPYYMSPEQINSARDVDYRSDIYSLGVTLYHLVCGQVPYTGSTFEVMTKHVREPLPSPQEHVADLPDQFGDVIRKMTAKDPERRYQSYEELTEDLDLLLKGEEVSAAGFTEESMVTQPQSASMQRGGEGMERSAEKTQIQQPAAKPAQQNNTAIYIAVSIVVAVIAAAVAIILVYG